MIKNNRFHPVSGAEFASFGFIQSFFLLHPVDKNIAASGEQYEPAIQGSLERSAVS
jgi:hypothetical protein